MRGDVAAGEAPQGRSTRGGPGEASVMARGRWLAVLGWMVLGILIGAAWPAGWWGVEETTVGAGDRSRKASERNEAGTARDGRGEWTVEDFLERVSAAEPGSVGGDPALSPEAAVLAGWSGEDFERALNEAIAGPEVTLEKSPDRAAARALLRAWMLKDAAGCLAWLEGVKSSAMKQKMATLLAWPPERMEEALSYALAHPEIYPPLNAIRGLWREGLEAAAKNGGAAAMEGHLAELRKAGYQPQGIFGIEYPPGFDYAALAKGPEGKKLWQLGRTEVMLGWLKQDRESAFQAAVAASKEKSWLSLDRTLVMESGEKPDPELAGWLAGKLSGLEEAQRSPVIRAQAEALVAEPASLFAFAAGLNGEDRRVVDEYAVRSLRVLGLEAALSHLEALGGPQERLALLETMDRVRRNYGVTVPEKFGPEDAVAFRSRLAAWGATPEQIGNIMKRVEGP